MELIKPYYEIMTPIDREYTLKLLELAGRTCYKSEDKITEESASKFCSKILHRNHLSVIEHVSATVKFVVDRGCCYDEQTEVLTMDGWKLFKDISEFDKLACLDDLGNLFYHTPSNKIVKKYDGELLHFESTSIDLLVTPNHQMWVFDYDKRVDYTRKWKFIQADQLTNNRYKFSKNATWNGTDISLTIPQHQTKYKQFPEKKLTLNETNDLFELLGIWITDGSFRNGKTSGSCLQISQTKQVGKDRINTLCKNIGLKCSWYKNEVRIDNLRLVNFVASLFGNNAKTFTAFVPMIIKSSSQTQIQRFLDGVMLGDGNVHKKNNHKVIYTSSYQFAGDLQELFLKIGLSANIRTILPRLGHKINKNLVKSSRISYVVSVHEKKRCKHLLDKRSATSFARKVCYTGNVYCLTVPYHRLYVRRNGKVAWCGNSHELVRHRLCSFSQESTRYVNYNKKGMVFIIPPWINLPEGEYTRYEQPLKMNILMDESSFRWYNEMLNVEFQYNQLILAGWQPQQARSILPNSLKTEIVTTANLREWKHIFTLRCDIGAHPQMREIMIPLRNEFQSVLPEIFGRDNDEQC